MFRRNYPTIGGFVAFLRVAAEMPSQVLPDSSPAIPLAFERAKAVAAPVMRVYAGDLYSSAVYNLGTHLIIAYANDQPGQDFFNTLRSNLGFNLFVPGVVSTTGSGPTSVSRNNPEFMKTFTMGDLDTLKTSYGREYMNLAQQQGTLWGLS